MENATVLARLQERFADKLGTIGETRSGEITIGVPRELIVEVTTFLRDDSELAYNFLENLCAVDYLGRTPRFEVVYHFQSPDYIAHMDRQQAILLEIYRRFQREGIRFAHPLSIVRLADGEAPPQPQPQAATAAPSFRH